MTGLVLLDPNISAWALIPIVVVTMSLQLLKHYAALMMKDKTACSPEFLKETQTIQKGVYTRNNRGWIPKEGFEERRRKINSMLKEKPESDEGNPMAAMGDPTAMRGMMGQQFLQMGPHLGMMQFVQYFFPSFVIAKLPFPLTSRFRGMFQRGIEHPTLDVTYVTSFCGYFLMMWGLRGIITLLLGGASEFDEAEHIKNMTDGSMGGGPKQVDMPKLYAAELDNWSEALTMHDFHLKNSEKRLLKLKAEL
eukprot:TRINITY_DN21208_c0_g1_i1.p1 TRINITY_DN21208_c0_g1~~TRINITY_DN21208_c0_g1_i1.p1  ORF type:complete len:250 (+),score=97.78 TRINITY_DN21208_c0_g1_i1:57-806(+)